MGKTAKKNWPLIGLIVVWFIFCYKFFIKGLIPAPLDFLTNFYNPWQAYEDYPIKNPAIPDVVSQIIPWKIYTIQSFKGGQIPFWNPYNFSGTPHLANFQSAIFNPVNFLFFVFPFLTAWSLFILLQPLMAGIFTYFYARKIGLGKSGGFLAALCFAFSGFLTVWLEYGTLGWAILWLPLTLYFWENFWRSNKLKYWLFINLIIAFSLLSGHLQISLYLFLANFLYLIFAFLHKRIAGNFFIFSLSIFFAPFLLTAFQILPTLELYQFSPRSQQIPVEWFKALQLPFSQLITFFFSDFYGHPATRNLWGKGSYVEMMGYIGFLPIILTLFYVVFDKKKKGLFFILLAGISFLLALPTPFSNLILLFKIPVLASSAPARIICLICFSLSLLAGLGLETFLKNLKNKEKFIMKFLLTILVFFIILFPLTYLSNRVAFKNIISSFVIFVIFLTIISISLKFNKKILINNCYLLITLLVIIDLFRFWHKFNPFVTGNKFYPNLPIINFVKNNAENYRVFDLFIGNLGLPFGVNSIEGYDSLTITDYQRLLKASGDGNPQLPSRTNGENLAKRGKYSKNLMDMLGVRYVINGKSDVFAFPTWEYPECFALIWEDKQNRIYENKCVLPRIFLTAKYKIVNPKDFLQETLKAGRGELVLLEDPKISPGENSDSQIVLKTYQSNKILIESNNSQESLLFLSDTFYPGWQAKIDGQQVPILKANYTFRSIKVPSGIHRIEFIYVPQSFKIGVWLSLLTGMTMILVVGFDKLIFRIKKK